MILFFYSKSSLGLEYYENAVETQGTLFTSEILTLVSFAVGLILVFSLIARFAYNRNNWLNNVMLYAIFSVVASTLSLMIYLLF